MNNRRNKRLSAKWPQYTPQMRNAMAIKFKSDCKRKFRRGQIREEHSNGDS